MADTLEVGLQYKVQDTPLKKVGKAVDFAKNKANRFEKALKRDGVTLKRVGQIGAVAFRQLKRSIRGTNKEAKNLEKTGSSMFKKLAGGAAAYFSVSAVKSFYSQSVAAANTQIEAETKLLAVVSNVRRLQGDQVVIKQATKSLIEYAGAIQKVGVIGDEVLISGQQQLATFQLMPDTIKKLTGGMADLLAQSKGLNAGTQDAVQLGNLFGKVMDGSTGALSRVKSLALVKLGELLENLRLLILIAMTISSQEN